MSQAESGSLAPGSKLVLSLLADNLRETIKFYESIGFVLTAAYPDTTENSWVELTRGPISIQFYKDPPKGTPANPVMSGTIYVYTTGVNDIAIELRKVCTLAWGPERMDYGYLEVAVQDPNGYFIAFAEAV